MKCIFRGLLCKGMFILMVYMVLYRFLCFFFVMICGLLLYIIGWLKFFVLILNLIRVFVVFECKGVE